MKPGTGSRDSGDVAAMGLTVEDGESKHPGPSKGKHRRHVAAEAVRGSTTRAPSTLGNLTRRASKVSASVSERLSRTAERQHRDEEEDRGPSSRFSRQMVCGGFLVQPETKASPPPRRPRTPGDRSSILSRLSMGKFSKQVHAEQTPELSPTVQRTESDSAATQAYHCISYQDSMPNFVDRTVNALDAISIDRRNDRDRSNPTKRRNPSQDRPRETEAQTQEGTKQLGDRQEAQVRRKHQQVVAEKAVQHAHPLRSNAVTLEDIDAWPPINLPPMARNAASADVFDSASPGREVWWRSLSPMDHNQMTAASHRLSPISESSSQDRGFSYMGLAEDKVSGRFSITPSLGSYYGTTNEVATGVVCETAKVQKLTPVKARFVENFSPTSQRSPRG